MPGVEIDTTQQSLQHCLEFSLHQLAAELVKSLFFLFAHILVRMGRNRTRNHIECHSKRRAVHTTSFCCDVCLESNHDWTSRGRNRNARLESLMARSRPSLTSVSKNRSLTSRNAPSSVLDIGREISTRAFSRPLSERSRCRLSAFDAYGIRAI